MIAEFDDDGEQTVSINEYLQSIEEEEQEAVWFWAEMKVMSVPILKILELWTKRSFRCDCGNSKFGEFSCKLFPNEDAESSENSYNHNFKGVYCTCNRPYPDPDRQEQEEMIQCCMCEDWFHEEHICQSSPDKVGKLDACPTVSYNAYSSSGFA
ncbi:putative RING-H2 finger protein ATL21A-like [Hibiscus syriacus]|uniref:RING-H2 finger protein ATL21A-like n=1 Tax=Hibiscus syriacus TaxID=106335 RepID=A0A6A2YFM0_HIBSY|nr:putative RING-H2 finger protein ATL21A-like [Hibiscus syriacus]